MTLRYRTGAAAVLLATGMLGLGAVPAFATSTVPVTGASLAPGAAAGGGITPDGADAPATGGNTPIDNSVTPDGADAPAVGDNTPIDNSITPVKAAADAPAKAKSDGTGKWFGIGGGLVGGVAIGMAVVVMRRKNAFR